MNKSQRTSLSFGIILVVLGAIFIAANLIPSFRVILNQANTWPMIIELVAAGLLVLGLMLGVPDMAVPATIVAGIGGILWWQNSTGNWASWAYMWALIPGFVGVGMLLAKVLGGRDRYSITSALSTIGSSLVMFVIFGAFFGGFSWMGPYWPLMLIVAGVLIGLNTLVKKH
ncbi:MAG: hypothetical protein VB013_07935 [Anaerolineaceae bacterium]|nr:hypothetical protein [Anaerolineaceae bacterium]